MQAVIVHPAADYAAGSPSLSFSVPQADGAPSAPKAPAEDGSRKSFDEMIHEARAESRAPSERQEAEQPPEAASHELSEQPVQLAERQLEARVPAEGGGGVPHDAEAGKLQAAPVPNRFQMAGRTASEKSDGRSDAARKGRGAAPKRTQDDGLGAAQGADAPLAFAALDGAVSIAAPDGSDAGAALFEGEAMEAAAALSVPIAAAEALPSSFAVLPADEKDMRAGAADIDERPRARRLALDSEGKIVVTDLRTERYSMQAAAGMPQEGGSARVIDADSAGGSELTVEFAAAAGADAAQQNILSGNSQTAGASSSTFQAMLSNQIQQNAGELVRAGSIVLRDNDAGSIKLVLHPESLGSVKIDLQISGKDITGRIMVASQEAYNAFKESAETLRHAFMQSGFENAGFDVAFSGSGSQNAASNGFGQDGRGDSRFAMAQTYGSLAGGSEDDASALGEIIGLSAKNAVNIVA